jgi:hypothetical protein
MLRKRLDKNILVNKTQFWKLNAFNNKDGRGEAAMNHEQMESKKATIQRKIRKLRWKPLSNFHATIDEQ